MIAKSNLREATRERHRATTGARTYRAGKRLAEAAARALQRALRVADDLAGAVATVGAADAAARMGAGAAQVEAVDRRPVVGVAAHRAQREELVEGHVAVQGVPAGDAEQALEVDRAEHLALLDRVGEAGHVALESGDRAVSDGVAMLVPGPLPRRQRVRLGVDVDRQHVLALRGERRIVEGRDADLDVGIG